MIAVAESNSHLAMKALAFRELSAEGYDMVFEPTYPPTRAMRWSRYRPDLFGSKSTGEVSEYVLVECETHPQMERLDRKEFFHLGVQGVLDAKRSLRRILIVPKGRLNALDMRIRTNCEIWVADVDRASDGGVAGLVKTVGPICRG